MVDGSVGRVAHGPFATSFIIPQPAEARYRAHPTMTTTSKRKAAQIGSEDGADERGNGAGGVGSGARPSKKSAAGTAQAGQPKSASASAGIADEPQQLQVPAEVWGHILDFMFYEEVRSALLVCKLIANDAVKHVQAITVMKSSQLDVQAARRFPNVRGSTFIVSPSTPLNGAIICVPTRPRAVSFSRRASRI